MGSHKKTMQRAAEDRANRAMAIREANAAEFKQLAKDKRDFYNPEAANSYYRFTEANKKLGDLARFGLDPVSQPDIVSMDDDYISDRANLAEQMSRANSANTVRNAKRLSGSLGNLFGSGGMVGKVLGAQLNNDRNATLAELSTYNRLEDKNMNNILRQKEANGLRAYDWANNNNLFKADMNKTLASNYFKNPGDDMYLAALTDQSDAYARNSQIANGLAANATSGWDTAAGLAGGWAGSGFKKPWR